MDHNVWLYLYILDSLKSRGLNNGMYCIKMPDKLRLI